MLLEYNYEVIRFSHYLNENNEKNIDKVCNYQHFCSMKF